MVDMTYHSFALGGTAVADANVVKPERPEEAIAPIGERIVARIKTVFDPEIPVNIYDLGLIYRIDVKPLENNKYDLEIDMTLTTPNCPVAGSMPGLVERAVSVLEELETVKINLVWDPPWDRSNMSDEARLQLNMF